MGDFPSSGRQAGNVPVPGFLSKKPIATEERLIFALDVPSNEQAQAFVDALGESVHFYKLGLELFMAGGYVDMVRSLVDQNKKVMVDLKFFDVPETVRSAVRQLTRFQATLHPRGAQQGHLRPRPASLALGYSPMALAFATVHGNEDILKAACEEKAGLKILAVTVLTSLDQKDLDDLGFLCDVKTLVLSRARRALAVGCDGVISSGLEASALRESLGEQFLIVTPGIRPVANTDDQKRTVDVEDAFRNGADYIVVGRPIREAPDPRTAAEEIQSRIGALFAQE